MARRSVRVFVLPLIAVFLTIAAYSQVLFRAENPTVPLAPGCVQVGLFLNNQNMNQSWTALNATLDYSADDGVLMGTPHVRLADFGTMPTPGLTNPATMQFEHGTGLPMTMCSPMNTINSVMLTGGMPIMFINGNLAGGMPMVQETVMPMSMSSGRINLLVGGGFNTRSLEDQLFAIVTFPVSGMPGTIHLNFNTSAPENNQMIDNMMMVFAASTTNGGVALRESFGIPTVSEWGLIAFLSGLLLSGLFLLRRKRTAV